MSLAREHDPAPRRAPVDIAVEASSAAVCRPPVMPRRAGPLSPPRAAPARGGHGATLLVMTALAAAAALWLRMPITQLAPPAAGLYAALGLPVPVAGPTLRDVRARLLRDGDRKILVTEGEIVNPRRREVAVPPLALAVRGVNGLHRYAWTVPAPQTRLGPGESVAFRARLAAPPAEGAEVVVRFAQREPDAVR
jgi:hypothetical protein